MRESISGRKRTSLQANDRKIVKMELFGSITNNLSSAVQSARRFRSHTVHTDTLGHWTDVLHHARRELAEGTSEPIGPLILQLERELDARAPAD